MTLATEGEASDGHILRIDGGKLPERMPLLVSHANDPVEQAGSISAFRKRSKDSPPRLEAVGQIEMDGPRSEIRRDLAHMISAGHVDGVSIRWDTVPGGAPPIRRTNLPSDHPYFVDAESEPTDSPRRWGSFFPEWRALEGSIVAIGADPQALIGRAIETDGEVREFWRSFADVPTSEDRISAMLAEVRTLSRTSVAEGASVADVLNAVVDDTDCEDFEAIVLGGRKFFLPADVVIAMDADQRRDEPAPEPDAEPEADPMPAGQKGTRWNPGDVAEALGVAMQKRDTAFQAELESLIVKQLGKV